MYRPEGWKKSYYNGEWLKGHSGEPEYNFEAGADAMLEGLKEKGVYRESVWPFDAPRQKTNGHWVFIPEEK